MVNWTQPQEYILDLSDTVIPKDESSDVLRMLEIGVKISIVFDLFNAYDLVCGPDDDYITIDRKGCIHLAFAKAVSSVIDTRWLYTTVISIWVDAQQVYVFPYSVSDHLVHSDIITVVYHKPYTNHKGRIHDTGAIIIKNSGKASFLL